MTLSLVAALASGGCVWTRSVVNDEATIERARTIKAGTTKGAELYKLLEAAPTMVLPGTKSSLYVYTFSDTKRHGLMLGAINLSKSNTVSKTLYIEVDNESDVVLGVRIPMAGEPKWEFWPFE